MWCLDIIGLHHSFDSNNKLSKFFSLHKGLWNNLHLLHFSSFMFQLFFLSLKTTMTFYKYFFVLLFFHSRRLTTDYKLSSEWVRNNAHQNVKKKLYFFLLCVILNYTSQVSQVVGVVERLNNVFFSFCHFISYTSHLTRQ